MREKSKEWVLTAKEATRIDPPSTRINSFAIKIDPLCTRGKNLK